MLKGPDMLKRLSYVLLVIVLFFLFLIVIYFNSSTINSESDDYAKIAQEYTDRDKAVIAANKEILANAPQVYCIGDSLTLGVSSTTSYPTILASETGLPITILGGANDSSQDIAIRLGASPIYVNDIIIPATTTPIEITIFDKNNKSLSVLKSNMNSFTPCTIQDITGNLNYLSSSDTYTFTRTEAGEEVEVDTLTQIIPQETSFKENSIAIFFTGSYDGTITNGIFNTITYQNSILKAMDTDRYIIVSLTSKYKFNTVASMNKVLKEEHNENFLDFRGYLLENGLEDANITPTEQDLLDITNGEIPSSLRIDDLNGNNTFNALLSKQLIEKMMDLEYITQEEIDQLKSIH